MSVDNDTLIDFCGNNDIDVASRKILFVGKNNNFYFGNEDKPWSKLTAAVRTAVAVCIASPFLIYKPPRSGCGSNDNGCLSWGGGGT